MTDLTINRYIASGTQAQRLAFTPAPATPASGPSPLCIWYETDTGFTYLSANAAAWVRVNDGLPWKPNCRAGTTTTLPANTYANGSSGVGATLTGNSNGALSAQDGVTLVVNERLLVKNESTGANNGIYVLTQVGTAGAPYILTRGTDADSGAELVNAVVKISEGSTLADTEYQCTTNATITVGSTSLTFAAAGGGGGGTTTNALTITNTGGASAGATFDGSAAKTIDYSTVGAAKTGAVTGSNLTQATARLLGRTTASTGAIEEISVGANLTLSAGSLAVSGGLVLLGTYTASGSTAIADFTSIPASYKDLLIVVSGRTVTAAFSDTLALTANGLTTSIYDRYRIASNSGASFFGQTLAAASLAFALTGDSAAANAAGAVTIEIIDYAGTTFEKKVYGRVNVDNSAVHDLFGGIYDGAIRLTSAINQVTLTAGGNMKSGSKIYLYGRG